MYLMYCVKLNELDFFLIYCIILNNLFNTFKAFSEGVKGPEGSPLLYRYGDMVSTYLYISLHISFKNIPV